MTFVPLAEDVHLQGQQLTQETLNYLSEVEEEQPGCVHTGIVYFTRQLDESQEEVLSSAERTLLNRRRRIGIAVFGADQAQTELRKYLWSPSAHEAFSACPLFTFEPDRHIELLSLSNTLITPITRKLVVELAEKENVLAIDVDQQVQPISGGITTDLQELSLQSAAGQANPARHRGSYTWGWDYLGIPDVHKLGHLGADVNVGVADSGVDANHADLIFKVKAFGFVAESGDMSDGISFDRVGHGTHVAGTIAGENNSGVWIGGAPRANIVASAVVGGSTPGSTAGLLKAFEWLGADPYGADVINLSLTIANPTSARQAILEHVVNQLRGQGIVCVAAVGNDAGVACSPAILRNVVGCGALTPTDDVWERSGLDPDFVLPGVSVMSCVPQGLPTYYGQTYGHLSGTSMAAAHMSGLLAIAMGASRMKGVNDIVSLFEETVTPHQSERSGKGVPNISMVLDGLG